MAEANTEGEGNITVSSMMKEIQGLKEKFKGDDDDACKLLLLS
jgi:hypothetical protein